MPLRSHRSAALKAREAIAADSSDSMSLPRYRDSPSSSKPQVSFSGEPPSSPSKNDGTLRMTVKMPPNKLASVGRTGGTRGVAQKVTKPSGGTRGVAQPKARVSSREAFEGGEILKSKRKREVKKSYVVESESDEEEDDAEGDDEVEEEDAMDMDDDEDAEGEDDDEDMSGQPPPRPIIKANKSASTGKSIITAKPASARKEVRPVETKEMASDDSDEELSELGSDMEDETMMGMGEEDAEGDEEEVEVEEEDDEEDEDSDLDTPGGGSRASTPDLSKLTRRQRARLEEGGSGHLLALPDEVQVKKHLTAEEHAMRRAEMARRRKNLSEKRNEEEKMETINKLLKKQAPKTSARRRDLNGENGTQENGEPGKPNPIFVRWISNKEGSSISVPGEWLESPVGEVLKNGVKQQHKQGLLPEPAKVQLLGEPKGGKMIEEIR